MKRISTLILVMLLLHTVNYAQKNLQEGYIIKNNADTIRGFIDYKEWYKNPSNVSFKPFQNNDLKNYKVAEISGFGINGKEAYQRYFTDISMDRNTIGNVNEKDSSSSKDSVFLKVLQQGKNVMLYSYADDIKLRFYILTNDATIPVELKNSQYLSNGQYIQEKEYLSVLLTIANKYAHDDKALQNAIYQKTFSKSSLMDICYTINGIDKHNMNAGTVKKSPINFFVGIGLNGGDIQVRGENKYAGLTNGKSFSPLFAAGLDLSVNPSIGRLFFRTQVTYSTYKTDAYALIKYYEANENYYLKFKQSNIGLHESLNFNLYNQESFKWFIGAGVGINFSTYPLNEETYVREGLSDTTTTVNNNYVAQRKGFWLNGVLKTGVAIKAFEISAAYLPKSSLSNYTKYDINNSAFQFQLNYSFKKIAVNF